LNTLNIKSVKGPRASLPHHPEYCDLVDIRSYARRVVGPLAIDLFSGAGGLSLGLEQAGFNVIMGVDHDTAAIETHAANFGGVSFESDLSHGVSLDLIVSMLSKLKIDLVAGGPPCQPFSRAGENKIKSLVRRLFTIRSS
jgi:DNA (cytosine-5)-methyltransferase 1